MEKPSSVFQRKLTMLMEAIDAINSLTDKAGVVASIDSDNSLLLTAEDANIDVQVNGAALVSHLLVLGYTEWFDASVGREHRNWCSGRCSWWWQTNLLGDHGGGALTLGTNTQNAVDTIDLTTEMAPTEVLKYWTLR